MIAMMLFTLLMLFKRNYTKEKEDLKDEKIEFGVECTFVSRPLNHMNRV